MAKDFQTQAQWALVAIPAPIYFSECDCSFQSGKAARPASSPKRFFHYDRVSATWMNPPRTFGRLGNRKMARVATNLDAGMVLPERSERCRVENISRTGCRLQISDPPRPKSTVLVRVERIEALGIVAWSRGNRCGIKFPSPLAAEAVQRIRWIVEHSAAHERNSLTHATAVWR